MPHLLFLYGTLHPDRAPAGIANTARRLKSLGRATIQGRLYDLCEYPGVILTDGADTHAQRVQGELFLLPDGSEEEVLDRLDDYEGFYPGAPERSLFLREMTQATLEDGASHACWVYTYNQPLP